MSHNQSVTSLAAALRNNPNTTFAWDDGAWIFAPGDWEKLRSHNPAQRQAWVEEWEQTVFDVADERARVHLETQSLLGHAELQRRIALCQREDEDGSGSLSCETLLSLCEATLAPARVKRWHELTLRRQHLDSLLAHARLKRTWLEEHPLRCWPVVSSRTTALHEARITLGLREGFGGPTASLDEVREFLREWIGEEPFTISFSSLDLVCATGSEPGVCLWLLDDPRFPVGEKGLRERALELGRALLIRFGQKRLGVLCDGDFVLLEREEDA